MQSDYCGQCHVHAKWYKSTAGLCWWCDPEGKAVYKPPTIKHIPANPERLQRIAKAVPANKPKARRKVRIT